MGLLGIIDALPSPLLLMASEMVWVIGASKCLFAALSWTFGTADLLLRTLSELKLCAVCDLCIAFKCLVALGCREDFKKQGVPWDEHGVQTGTEPAMAERRAKGLITCGVFGLSGRY
jgi:hypothetical protein